MEGDELPVDGMGRAVRESCRSWRANGGCRSGAGCWKDMIGGLSWPLRSYMKVIFTKQLKTIQSPRRFAERVWRRTRTCAVEALLVALRLCAILAIACVWGLYWFWQRTPSAARIDAPRSPP